ncbi:MAG TPA: flagellar filament capping protein FliD [Pirellulales bacterium]|jgi:flagellar hook-associated protein 2|nr:flagellar filament capping protein FliD [Pirellulales bacterium]
MSQIQSSVGLVTGFPIAATVQKLMALNQEPVTALQNQDTTYQNQETAIEQLQALLSSLEVSTNALGQSSLYSQTNITSSNSSVLTAATNPNSTATPALGNFEYTALQQAQAQQLESSGLASDNTALGAGSLSFRYGPTIDQPVSVDLLNGGQGISPGSIEITGRNGVSDTINLSSAQTIGDVVNAINSASGLQVVASVNGDHLQLSDVSGSSANNLQISEVAGGTTAASLGLANINSSSSTVEGSNILSLFDGLPTSELNSGNGVQFDSYLPDVQVQLSDGSTVDVTLHQQATTGTFGTATTDAANGVNASLLFTAKQAGSNLTGVTINFVDNSSITPGNETANYDSTTKTLTFDIDQGQTTANDLINALNASPTASALFSATTASGGNGTGLVTISDVGLTAGPKATATTDAANGSDAALQFTAVSGGPNYDGVQVEFEDNPSITAGNETVAYDTSDPSSPKLVFQIAQGQTTASDIVNALAKNSSISQLFTASLPSGDDGSGLISTSDTATTDGGEIVEPVASDAPTTIGDILNAFNSADPGKLSAQISSNGQGIQLIDNSGGSGAFSISDINGSQAVEGLGLNASASGNTISGNPLFAGLSGTLLSNLNGGNGVGTLGSIDITDRAGNSTAVNLSSALSVDDVINDINTAAAGAGVGITASVNQAGNGIQLTDTTGSTARNLIVADADSSDTAEALGIAVNAAESSVNSGDLHLQSVSENTTLASYNGGGGVAQGSFTITGTNGQSATINVSSSFNTIGDVINAINQANVGVTAKINSAGDGIELVDTAHGSGTLSVTAGGTTTAADLHLTNTPTTATIGGQSTQIINGSTTETVNITSSDTLQTLISKINSANAGVQASEVNTGSEINPYRLVFTADQGGTAGNLQFDTSNSPISLTQTTAGQDALLLVGSGNSGFVASSPTDTFSNVLAGANLTLTGTSTTPVSLTVAQDPSSLATAIQSVVTGYNSIISNISSATAYNTTTDTGAVLEGNTAVLQVQTALSNLISGQLAGNTGSQVQSLADLGITVNQDGSLSLNSTTLSNLLASDSQAVQQFLATANTGLSAQFQTALAQLSGPTNSLLTNSASALNTEITDNQTQITQMNAQLTVEQNELTAQFDQMELTVEQLQSNLSAISSIQPFATIGGGDATQSLDSTSGDTLSSDLSDLSNNIGSGFG